MAFFDAAPPRFFRLGALDCHHVTTPVAVGKRIEGAPGRFVAVERLPEVGRHRHFARPGVELYAKTGCLTDALLRRSGFTVPA